MEPVGAGLKETTLTGSIATPTAVRRNPNPPIARHTWQRPLVAVCPRQQPVPSMVDRTGTSYPDKLTRHGAGARLPCTVWPAPKSPPVDANLFLPCFQPLVHACPGQHAILPEPCAPRQPPVAVPPGSRVSGGGTTTCAITRPLSFPAEQCGPACGWFVALCRCLRPT